MLEEIIDRALEEDIGPGDHSTLSCVPANATGVAKLLVKDDGIIAGVELAELIFKRFDPELQFERLIMDGSQVKKGDVVFIISGASRSILSTERLVLNFMQRMSGIATQTSKIIKHIEGTGVTLLDTRKTTPGIRFIEKWAVRIGGGQNHRFALYDMVMLKDNHVDYAGGITQAIKRSNAYLQEHELDLKIEIEVRNLEELKEVLSVGRVDRIMLDNFTPELLREAMTLIPETYETEASGGITIDNIRAYAETGVQYISVGALTHSVKSLDLSLKATYH